MKQNTALLAAAYMAYAAGAEFRSRRVRFKQFTYGRQWGDEVIDPDGKTVTEGEMAARHGKMPMTNNLLRQLVKTVVGNFRSSLSEPRAELAETASRNMLDELDSRLLEEFLISGCAIQRISHERRPYGAGVWVDNVNPARFFVSPVTDPRAMDVELAGMLHDFSMPELMMRFARGSRQKAMELKRMYVTGNDNDVPPLGVPVTESLDFFTAPHGRCRVIEVWTLDCVEMLRCHDRDTADYFLLPVKAARRIDKMNATRKRRGKSQLEVRWEMQSVWQCRWLSPWGDVLDCRQSDMTDGCHPFVMKFYPLTDGEIHPFVEDVIDQQKYVNRLITLIDNIMGASAKGVLLFPEQQLSPSMDWGMVKQLWTSYDGVIPYRARPGEPEPHQVSAKNTDIGAHELLQLQLKLFEEISGVSGALQGRSPSTANTSARMFEAQTRNSAIALADIFATFDSFRRLRNERIVY